VFLDVTDLMLQPLVRRTWPPEGQTPVIHCWDRHDRLSGLGALTVSPVRRRLGLYFRAQEGNLRAPDVARLLGQVHRQVRPPLIVILDRWAPHRAAARKSCSEGSNRFWFESLPPYAPDLNPVEHASNHTKYGDSANYVLDDLPDMEFELEWSINQTRERPKRVVAVVLSCR
jgi:transposase